MLCPDQDHWGRGSSRPLTSQCYKGVTRTGALEAKAWKGPQRMLSWRREES